MILYLDTSALVKAYVNETFSNEILNLIKSAKIVASHLIAYVEAHAAFARIKRDKILKTNEFEKIKLYFMQDWENYLHIESTQDLMQRAADFTDGFSLRAYDSVHLAAADLLVKKTREKVMFACFDIQLNKAAHILGLNILKN